MYVTLVSTYTDFSTKTGLGFINTTTENLEDTFLIDNVSSGYGSLIAANSDFTKVYLITSSYDADWNLIGEVSSFDVNTGTFDAEPVVNNVAGLSGIAFNNKDNQFYVFSALSATGVGSMKIYSEEGSFVKEYAVGAYPVGAFFLE